MTAQRAHVVQHEEGLHHDGWSVHVDDAVAGDAGMMPKLNPVALLGNGLGHAHGATAGKWTAPTIARRGKMVSRMKRF